MICEIDATGVCKRHHRTHPTDEIKWALTDTMTGEAFRREWDKPAQNSEPAPVCRHFTESPTERAGCGTCPASWVYPCEVYGSCSPLGYHVGVKRCSGCVHFIDRDSAAPETVVRRLVLLNDCCPGDVTVSTAAIESLHRAHPGVFLTAVAGTAPDLFHHNPNVVRRVDVIDGATVSWEVVPMRYPLIDHCDAVPVHFMHGYCDHLERTLGVRIPLATNRPHLYLSPEESGWTPQVHEIRPDRPRYVLVNAGHKDDYPAKWWGTSNYQRVVDLLKDEILFVQIGEASHTHPALTGVLDMRGKTDTRQLVRMAYHSAGGVGPSTFLQHLCAAFEKPYVCVAGGREPLVWQNYPRQVTLSTIGVTPCAPSRQGKSCWRDRVTPDPTRPVSSVCELPVLTAAGEAISACLDSITPERVAEELRSRYNNGTIFR